MLCTECAPADTRAWWWCATHTVPGSTAQHRIIHLPALLSDATGRSIESALSSIGDWSKDPDLKALADDVEDTLRYGASCKGTGAIRRLSEYVISLPPSLRNAEVSEGTLDFVLAAYIGARCRTARRTRGSRPSQWKGSKPSPPSVGGEVNALIGLSRVAGLLPANPTGSIPRTRRALRTHGCLRKLDASPRSYTFFWELAAALPHCTTARAFAVWAQCIVTICFLLRPRYARDMGEPNLARLAGGRRYQFQLDTGDKTNRPRLMPCTSSDDDGEDDDDRRGAASAAPTSGRRTRPPTTDTQLPAAHPRFTVAQHPLLSHAMEKWTKVRGPVEPGQPLFCRIEPARQQSRAPKGARLTHFDGQPCWLWPNTKLSDHVRKSELVAFLTPVIGPERARKRVLSGLRGGGETEFAHRRIEPHVRATIGWWKIRRLKEVGCMVGYEGTSIEEMCDATRQLGSTYIRYVQPGVFTVTPPVPRGAASRRRFPRACPPPTTTPAVTARATAS